MQHVSQFAIPILLMLWIVYRRIKRTIGIQPLKVRRMRIRVIIFSVIGVLIFALSLVHPLSLIGDAVGIAIGAVLASYAIRHCVIEQRDGMLYYRTLIWIDAAVVILFLGRVLYRFYFIFTMDAANPTEQQMQNQNYMKDPWTAGVFFLIITYYIVYYVYLMRKEKILSAGSQTGAEL